MDSGSFSDATFAINWQQKMTKDRSFGMMLESFHIEETIKDASKLGNELICVEVDEIFPNNYDSLVGGNSGTLAVFRGISYQAQSTDHALQISSPRWQTGTMNVKLKFSDGSLIPFVNSSDSGMMLWVATFVYSAE
jgi:hypothetical protein